MTVYKRIVKYVPVRTKKKNYRMHKKTKKFTRRYKKW